MGGGGGVDARALTRLVLQHYLGMSPVQVAVQEFVDARAGEGQNPCWMVAQASERASAIVNRFENTMLADVVMDGDGVVHCTRYKDYKPPVRAFFDRDFIDNVWKSGHRWDRLRNKVRLYYGYDPHLDRWLNVDVESASVGTRAVVEEPLEVYTYFAYSGAALVRANDFLKLTTANPLVIEFRSRGKLVDLKIGDRITVTRSRAMASGGALSSVVFRVRRIAFDHQEGSGDCEAYQDVAL